MVQRSQIQSDNSSAKARNRRKNDHHQVVEIVNAKGIIGVCRQLRKKCFQLNAEDRRHIYETSRYFSRFTHRGIEYRFINTLEVVK